MADPIHHQTATGDTATLCAVDCGVTSTWAELFGLIPGYDCVATAGRNVFCPEVADGVVRFFETQLTHVEGALAGKPFVLEPWQRAVVGAAFGWFRPDGTRRYRKVFQYVPRKNGKALALDTPIPTPTGWTTVGEIMPGDIVYDEHGRQCNVLACSEYQINRPCYRLTFSDGTNIVADAEHEWFTETRRTGRVHATGVMMRGRKRDESKITYAEKIKTTEKIADTLAVKCRSNDRRKATECNHRIPVVSGPIVCNAAALSIDPYILGAWLGDGHSSCGTITIADKEVIAQIINRGAGLVKINAKGQGKASPYRIATADKWQRGNLTSTLRHLDLLNNKHIPAQYLRASPDQRWELLRGMMDTDGYCSKAGQCEFTTIKPAIRDGFLELARSLGLKPTCIEHRATIYGRDCGPKYRIQFWCDSSQTVFYINRKQSRLKAVGHRARSRSRQIVACDRVPSVPVRCIQVDSPSRLFLAGEGMVPTHNSSMLAGLLLLMAYCDNEPGAQLYSIAADRDQAALVYRIANGMIHANPTLAEQCKRYKTYKSIEFPLNTIYKALSSDADTKHGLNTHFVICDELHAHYNRDLVDVLETSMGSRRQPLIWYITTADYDRVSICNEVYEYACKVRDGTYSDEAFLPVVFEASRDDDYLSPDVWEKANPNIGVSVSRDYLAAEARKAEAVPAYRNTFKRLHLNIRTQTESVGVDLPRWDRNAEIIIDVAALSGQRCWLGLDFGSTRDTTAAVLCFPPATADGHYTILPRIWIPQETAIVKEKNDGVPYMAWHEAGLIRFTPGSSADYSTICHDLADWFSTFDVRQVLGDRFQAEMFMQKLEAIYGAKCKYVPQSHYGMHEPTIEFEKAYMAGKLAHGGHKVLRWMAENCVQEHKGGKVRFIKGGEKKRIDGIIASVMALAGAIKQENVGDDNQSAYNDPNNRLAFV